MTLNDLVQILWRRKRGIGLTSLSFAVLAAILSQLSTPVYRAEALLAPVAVEQSASPAMADLTGFAGFGIRGAGRSDEYVAVLGSRALTVRFIKEKELLPILLANRWDEESGKWKRGRLAKILSYLGVPNTDRPPSDMDAFAILRKSLRITRDQATGLVSIAIDWRDAEQAAEWTNGLVERVNAEMRERDAREAMTKIERLKEEIGRNSDVALRDALYRLLETEMKNILVTQVRAEYAFRVVDPAVAPESPRWPQPVFMTVLGLVGGALTGAIFTVMRQNIDLRRRQLKARG